MVIKNAYAKINLALDVISKRPDNYHEVDMILTPLVLHDVLTFEKLTNSNEILLDAPATIGVVSDNLIYRAAQILQKNFKITDGVKITLEKNIPIAAGLAGGSSDAAVTLQALVDLWKIKISNEELATLAITLGADVPYCLYQQTMRAQGIGEKLTVVDKMLETHVVLFKPQYGISTKIAYENIQEYHAFSEGHVPYLLHALKARTYQEICKALFNSFEKSTFELYPELLQHKMNLARLADAVLLSGSGPTLFALVTDEVKLIALEKYGHDNDLQTIITKTR